MRTAVVSRTANIRDVVKSLRIRELQVVLADLNLSRSGRKQELVDRIVNSLEQFELKANENASNHATSLYYSDLLTAGLRSLDTQYRVAHHGQSMSSVVAAAPPVNTGYAVPPPLPHTPPPPSMLRTPPPMISAASYGRPLPYPGHNSTLPHRHHLAAPHHAPPPPASHGTEVLKATMLASLGGARCFCGAGSSSSNSGGSKVVMCVECGLRVHAKCHQLVTATNDEWYCESCRAMLCDPFIKVQKTLLAPVFVKFNRNQVPLRIEYTMTDQDISDLYAKRDPKPGTMTAGSQELQLRCFVLKEELGTGTSWPTTSTITTNGFNMVLVQRSPPGQSNPSKVLREQPASLFQCSRTGRNVIEVRTGENPLVFVFMVQIVEFQSVDSLMSQVKAASADITYEAAKQEVIKSFGEDDEDDDDAIVTTSTILSVRCPLGLCVIDLPARGVQCKHMQCFDLRTFLLFNKKARSRHYRCTVCHNFIKASDLRIDPYLKKLLNDVQGEDELEEVEISPDASWKRRVDEDAVATPPQKRLKQETSDISTVSSASAAPSSSASVSAPAAASAGSAAAPFEIDLSLSSDEEDDAIGAFASLPAAYPTSSTSGTASTSTLSDDDVAIFTVDSDVWETGSGSNGFPLDLFASFAGPTGSEVQTNGSANSWNGAQSYGAVSAPSAAAPSVAVSASAWPSAPRAPTSGSDSTVPSATTQPSRNHAYANSASDRQAAAPRPSAGGGNGSGMMDVIELLDSDSDSE